MTSPRLHPDDAGVLYVAAVVGTQELAIQLQRLGISESGESMQDARLLRRDLLETVERMRQEPEG